MLGACELCVSFALRLSDDIVLVEADSSESATLDELLLVSESIIEVVELSIYALVVVLSGEKRQKETWFLADFI